MNQGVAERHVPTESRKGWEGEDVTGRGITLKLVEKSENDMLRAEAGG